ncbi:MAG: hypothetical protein HOJ16_08155 [Candidatus Peribacter sp.]|nr:hypothetical protein [Candidatus Peribacter sp.]MBT6049675.1 hypothetical protein [Candidatus Scalindua sp.]
MKKDLNQVAKIEKAVREKYGEEAVAHPKNDWTDEKEKTYIEQMKEFYKKLELSKVESEREERSGFFISRKSEVQTMDRSCKTCDSYSFNSRDDVYFTKYDCCFGCYIQYVEGRTQRWLSGWRPNNTRGFGK